MAIKAMTVSCLSVLLLCLNLVNIRADCDESVARISVTQSCSTSCNCALYTDGIHLECSGRIHLPINKTILSEIVSVRIEDSSDTSLELQSAFEQVKNVRKIVMQNFNLRRLGNIFKNLSLLEELDLHENDQLTDIDSNIFLTLVNLQKVRFAKMSQLRLAILQHAMKSLRSSKIDTFVIDKLKRASKLTANFFLPFKNYTLKKLVLANLNIREFEPGFSTHIHNITCVILSGNGFSGMAGTSVRVFEMEIFMLNKLRFLDGSNAFRKYAMNYVDLCSMCEEPLSKSTEVIDLEPKLVAKTEDFFTKYCRTVVTINSELRYFYVHNFWDALIHVGSETKVLCVTYTNKIRYIDTSDFDIQMKMGLYGFLRLQYVNLQGTRTDKILYHTFANIPSLQTLLLGRNDLGAWFSDGNATFALRNLKHLESIDLEACKISTISDEDFQTLIKIKFVNLTNNRINAESLSNDFDMKFDILNLSNNNVQYLPGKFLNSFDVLIKRQNKRSHKQNHPVIDDLNINIIRYSLPTVDLTGNDLECSCDGEAFIRWFKTKTNRQHLYKSERYFCQFGDKRVSLKDVDIKCPVSPDGQTFNLYIYPIIGGITSLAAFTIVTFLAYRYKRQLNYYLCFIPYIHFKRTAFKRLGNPYKNLLEENSDRFDVFILCSGDDGDFVQSEIKPKLIECGFSVTLGEDDFIPGQSIISEIEHALYSSTCALLILSTNFIRSPWLDFEVTMAIAMKRKVVIVKLDDPPYSQMPSALIYLYKRHEIRQKYPRNKPENLPKFWQNIATAITKMKTNVL